MNQAIRAGLLDVAEREVGREAVEAVGRGGGHGERIAGLDRGDQARRDHNRPGSSPSPPTCWM